MSKGTLLKKKKVALLVIFTLAVVLGGITVSQNNTSASAMRFLDYLRQVNTKGSGKKSSSSSRTSSSTASLQSSAVAFPSSWSTSSSSSSASSVIANIACPAGYTYCNAQYNHIDCAQGATATDYTSNIDCAYNGVMGKCVSAQCIMPSSSSLSSALSSSRSSSSSSSALSSSSSLHAAAGGIWISREEIMRLPMTGSAWTYLVNAAKQSIGVPDISNQDDNSDQRALVKALVGIRTGNEAYVAEARAAVIAAMETENDGQTLALGRNLAGWVITADLVGLSPEQDAIFRTWLRSVLTENLEGRTLKSTHEDRPNNWGTMAGGSRAVVAVYLGDAAEIERTAKVFKGWLGDRASYAGFKYNADLSWQSDPTRPVGINPKGAVKDGHSIDGAQPEDMRRGAAFQWPPVATGYPWEAMQGVIVQAEVLYRAGYDTYSWQDEAVKRASDFLYMINWPAEGDDNWMPWILNARYGMTLPTTPNATVGKIMSWAQWTHAAP